MMNSKSVINMILIIIFFFFDMIILPQVCKPVDAFPFPQSPFADERLAQVFPIIQNFKTLITSDPFNVTATWVGPNICNYRGFFCDAPPDNQSATALASVDFNGFQFTAPTLAGFLDQLPDIALFHANSNNFAGTISPATATLPYLYELDISNNKFSGPFPAAVLSMQTLTFLDIRFNSFSGAVPAQLFDKQSLDVIFLNDNNFYTKLPETLQGGSSIRYLTLANNNYFGPIPRGIWRSLSAELTEIVLLNNLLTGCVPYEMGFLKKAVVLDVGGNRLTGRLPYSLGCLEKVEIVNFAGNMLYGNVPEVVCALGSMVNLSLSDNYLTQVGQACWGLIRSGVLDVRRNCIPGLPFQRSVAECAAFFAYPRRYSCPYWPTHPHFATSPPS